MKTPIRRLSPRCPERPVRELRGTFLIAAGAWDAAARLLPTYRDQDADHEGIVFLLGRRVNDLAIITTAAAPRADHGPGHVFCDEPAMRDVARAGRASEVAVVAQLHSHPGAWTGHSDGDDTMIFMPFENMLSIVAPHYGRTGLRPVDTLGVHQFQEGRWVRAQCGSVRAGITVVPSEIDLR